MRRTCIGVPLRASFGPVTTRIRRFSPILSGDREVSQERAKPPQDEGFRSTAPTGATGLEPATPGFGDRCATNCATPLGCARDCIRAQYHRPVPLVALFLVITASFGAIAVWSATAGQWVIAACAAALCLWMGSFAWGGLRKMRS